MPPRTKVPGAIRIHEAGRRTSDAALGTWNGILEQAVSKDT